MMTIKDILTQSKKGQEITLKGWVRTFRSNRFIAINDGSTIINLQCVVDLENINSQLLKQINVGVAISIQGILSSSIGKEQEVEVQVSTLDVLGTADTDNYPIQPKKHSLEFLREKAHLRIRTNVFGAIMRIRSSLAFAVHKYFMEEGFHYVNSSIITGNDCEGAGEIFRVSTLDFSNPPLNKAGTVDYAKDFFGKETNLTVSGQLQAEAYAMALGKVYTFGPTFRAENSNTSRHLSEFWMIEPEVAFMDLEGNMDLAQRFVKSVINYVLEHCQEDLVFLQQRLLKEEKSKLQHLRSDMSLIDKLRFVVDEDFIRISYTEAIEILKNSNPNKKKKFQYLIKCWGENLQSEHERYLVEKHFKRPVIVYDYPSEIKAFYMRENKDGKTVRAMDILFPGIGEVIGGSQREERLDILKKKMKDFSIDDKELQWYLDLRRFGTAPHSGFGLGFERLVLFVTGMTNVRDVIPFPRTPKNAEY